MVTYRGRSRGVQSAGASFAGKQRQNVTVKQRENVEFSLVLRHAVFASAAALTFGLDRVHGGSFLTLRIRVNAWAMVGGKWGFECKRPRKKWA